MDDAVDAAPAEPPKTESAADETVKETPSIDEPDEEALSTVEEAKVDEVSSYYHLARFNTTSSAKAAH